MKTFEQTKDYNCGVFALHFIIGLYGISADPEYLETITGTTIEDGTSHGGLKKGLAHYNLKWVEWSDSHISTLQEFLPAIINYQYCDEDGCDGHYCVVLGQGHGFFIIYNPATSEIETLDTGYLENNWYSERYGKGWFIQPVKDNNHEFEPSR